MRTGLKTGSKLTYKAFQEKFYNFKLVSILILSHSIMKSP